MKWKIPEIILKFLNCALLNEADEISCLMLSPTWAMNRPFVQRINAVCSPPVGHQVAISVIRSSATVSSAYV